MNKHSITSHSHIPIWSNVPFFIPAVLAAQKGLWAYGLLIAIATVISLVHHIENGINVKRIDQFFALSVIAANLYVLHLSGWKQPYFGIALLFVAIAFYFFFRGNNHKYDLYHGLWHLNSVVITMMCVLAY